MERESAGFLSVEGLKTYFYTRRGIVKAVDGIDLRVDTGQTLGIVGESGCGKSVTALSILRLIPSPPGKIVDGSIYFRGENLLEKTEEEMRDVRGNKISMIFQNPMTSLNPVYTIGTQIVEVIERHQGLSHQEAVEKAVEMIRIVGLPDPEKRINNYPHQLSGGMNQRAMIAMALSCHSSLLIADEPTTALDVTIQAQIIRLMKSLREEFRTSVILITHDLGLVAGFCDKVVVMYAGNVVESADTNTIFKDPKHPYTIGLMNSIPRMDRGYKGELEIIKGEVPTMIDPPPGCKFHPRCPRATSTCARDGPELTQVGPGHRVACHQEAS
jgi:oligopeptide/dipeptide ABC transporter ATP-binding protein